MTRREIRYWFFRFKNALEVEGASDEGAPSGLKEHYEEHPHFGGWENFGVTWDLDPEDVEVIVPLRYSLEQQWNTEIASLARPFPVPEPNTVKTEED